MVKAVERAGAGSGEFTAVFFIHYEHSFPDNLAKDSFGSGFFQCGEGSGGSTGSIVSMSKGGGGGRGSWITPSHRPQRKLDFFPADDRAGGCQGALAAGALVMDDIFGGLALDGRQFASRRLLAADFRSNNGHVAFSGIVEQIPQIWLGHHEEHRQHAPGQLARRRLAFRDEYRALLGSHGINWDERWVWD